jgi:hypothetical protein
MRITLDLNCGKDTCAKAFGDFCQYLTSRRGGYVPQCLLFNECLFDSNGDVLGWLLRCEKCKKAGNEWQQRTKE